MNKVLVTVPSVLLAIFCAACGDDSGTVAGGTGGMGASPGAGGMGTSGIGGMGTGGTAMPGAGGTATPGAGGGTVTPGAGGGTVTPGAGGGTVTPGAGGGTVTPGAGGGTVTPGAGGTTPGAGGTTPGAGGTTPGAGGTTPGAGGANPGTGGSEPGSGGAATGGNGGEATGGQGTGGSVTNPQFVSTAQGAEWQEGTCTEATGNAEITVNDGAGGQTWEGFGAAFNEKGWSFLTTQAMQDEAIQLLFGTDGCNFTWGRIPMGASDYAMDRYTLDDTSTPVDPDPDGETNRPPPDTSLSKFSLARDGEKLIPYVKAALAVKPDLKFWASPWTPPVWMKTGYMTVSGSDRKTAGSAREPSFFDGGTFNGTDANLAAYAEYYKKFVQGYKDQGINIELVSPQNEPRYDQNYPSCLWDKAVYVKWIGQYLGPAMQSMDVKVMLGSLSNAEDSPNDLEIASAVLADNTAKSFLACAGVQWGVLDKVRDGQLSFNGLPVWASEHRCGNYPWGQAGTPAYNSQKAPNDHAYGVESWGYIRDAILKAKVTSYNAWNMVLDTYGLGIDTSRDWKQNALLVAEGGSLTKTHAYYVFRHFSQFVVPGAKVVSATGSDTVAFKNPDGGFVAVVYNSGGAKSSTISIGGKTLQCQLPGDGWATVNVTP